MEGCALNRTFARGLRHAPTLLGGSGLPAGVLEERPAKSIVQRRVAAARTLDTW